MSRHLAPLFGLGTLARTTLALPPLTPPRPAAGVLLRYTDTEGDWWLLGKRTARLGGTWANFGGSLNPDETPLVGALRELYEEADIDATDLAGAELTAEHHIGDDAVPYTLFVLTVPALLDSHYNWEHDDAAWWRGDAVPTLDLHRGLAAAWASIRPDAAAA